MYDVKQRRSATNITVGEFCRYLLENVPADAVFHVGGVSHFYLHVDEDNKAVSVDDSDLACEEDYVNWNEHTIKSINVRS